MGVVKADFSEEVTSEWRLEMGRSQLYREPGRGKNMCMQRACGGLKLHMCKFQRPMQ